MAFAIAAILAKSSTLYNPVVYLLFKPNFRKFLCRDAAHCRRCLCAQLCCCKRPVVQKEALRNKEFSNSTRLSNGLPESHTTCRHWQEIL